MNLIPKRNDDRWTEPFRAMDMIRQEMNRLFAESLARWAGADDGLFGGGWAPAMDVTETKDLIRVRAEVPGMSRDEIQVFIHDNTLTIQGEKKRQGEVKEGDVLRTEQSWGRFCREMTLPAEIDVEKVKATCKDGILELALPKKEDAGSGKTRIDVQ